MLIVGYVCILLVLEGEGFRNIFDSRSFEKRGMKNQKSMMVTLCLVVISIVKTVWESYF